MQEPTFADLKTLPGIYYSPRSRYDILVGEDNASDLIEASCSGDAVKLESLLSQPQWAMNAFEEQHVIYYKDRSIEHNGEIQQVMARPMSNVERAIIQAARAGHAETISTLLAFVSQQGRKPLSMITYEAMMGTIEGGHADVLAAMAAADLGVINFYLSHSGPYPLDLAVARWKIPVVIKLLELGADPSFEIDRRRGSRYRTRIMSLAKRPVLCDLLAKHGIYAAETEAPRRVEEQGIRDATSVTTQQDDNADSQPGKSTDPN